MLSTQFNAVDREAVWAALFAWFQSKLTALAWSPGETIAAGTLRRDPQGYLQQAQNSGTAGDTVPEWDDAIGAQTVDGGYGQTPFGSGGFGDFAGVLWQTMRLGFISMGRKHVAPPDLVQADQPAMFQVAVKEMRIPQKPPGAPPKLYLKGYLILYAPAPVINENIGAEQFLGETILNQLFYSIDTALVPDNEDSGKFTIGGLVEHCWIEGDCDLDPGIFGPQAAAILPLHILV